MLHLGILNTKIHGVRHVPRGTTSGQTAWDALYFGWRRRPRHLRGEVRGAAELIMAFAGGAAERRSRWHGPRGDGFDVEDAEDLAVRLTETDEEARALLALQRIRAAQLVARHWPAIRAVAKALDARGALTGREVREIVARAEETARRAARARRRRTGAAPARPCR